MNYETDEITALRRDIIAGRVKQLEPAEAEKLPANFRDIEDELIEGLNFVEELNTKIDELKAKLLAAMELNGVKKWESDRLAITRTEAGSRTTFDSKRFKEEQPLLYDAYVKISDTKPSIRITLKTKTL